MKMAMAFKDLITGVLAKGNLKQNDIDWVVNNHLEMYERAFTSKTVNPLKNYEDLEQKGDAAANDFLVWYFYRRFPQLDCPAGVPTIARLKIVYSSKATFSAIARRLGFWPHIRASPNERENREKSLLEDVFEAFVGATVDVFNKKVEMGFGNIIANRILTSLFDDIVISLQYNDLYDAKTRLKEYFDTQKGLGRLITEYNEASRIVTLYTASPMRQARVRVSQLQQYINGMSNKNCTFTIRDGWATVNQEGPGGSKKKLAHAVAATKAEAEQIASEIALEVLKVPSTKQLVFCE